MKNELHIRPRIICLLLAAALLLSCIWGAAGTIQKRRLFCCELRSALENARNYAGQIREDLYPKLAAENPEASREEAWGEIVIALTRIHETLRWAARLLDLPKGPYEPADTYEKMYIFLLQCARTDLTPEQAEMRAACVRTFSEEFVRVADDFLFGDADAFRAPARVRTGVSAFLTEMEPSFLALEETGRILMSG